jgi:hypothetical protein
MIERRIFGREPKSKTPCVQCGAETYGRGTGCAYADCRHDGPDLDRVPCYSTDIGAAFRIVEKWRKSDQVGGYGEMSMRCEGSDKSGIWVVGFGQHDEVAAPTLAHAVCLAALKAVG